ncbi:MAG: hypothetical protein AAF401_04425, partial [Pseudomonadota bacterium]
DFKSDAAPPRAGAAPDAYLAQIGAYMATLQRIYPDHEIKGYLLWTGAPRLDLVDPNDAAHALNAALEADQAS